MKFTHRNDERDHQEWHRGIRSYVFWSFIIEDTHWLKAISDLQARLDGFLHPDYLRVPHVTVFSVGLLNDRNSRTMTRQATSLESSFHRGLRLFAEGFDSYPHCPYIRVACPDGTLQQMRSSLASIADEDRESAYTPHVTLGLYDLETPLCKMFAAVADFDAKTLPHLTFSELCLCRYETHSIKGPIEILQRVSISQ